MVLFELKSRGEKRTKRKRNTIGAVFCKRKVSSITCLKTAYKISFPIAKCGKPQTKGENFINQS